MPEGGSFDCAALGSDASFGNPTACSTLSAIPVSVPATYSQAAVESGETTRAEKNPLFGQTTYLVLNAVFRRTYLKRRVPANLLDEVGTTRARLPGGLPTPKGRNWLVMPPKVARRGNVFEITEEWMLSKPGEEWPEALYRLIER